MKSVQAVLFLSVCCSSAFAQSLDSRDRHYLGRFDQTYTKAKQARADPRGVGEQAARKHLRRLSTVVARRKQCKLILAEVQGVLQYVRIEAPEVPGGEGPGGAAQQVMPVGPPPKSLDPICKIKTTGHSARVRDWISVFLFLDEQHIDVFEQRDGKPFEDLPLAALAVHLEDRDAPRGVTKPLADGGQREHIV